MKQVSRITKNKSHPRRSRRGFTLIEVMVVIGIIAFLMTIAVTTFGYVISAAKVTATKDTIKVIAESLAQRRAAFDRAIEKQDQDAGDGWPDYALTAKIEANSNLELAKILGKKKVFRKFFPQLYTDNTDEITNPGGTHVSETESSELLYFMLTEGTSIGVKTADIDSLKSGQIADTDGDGRMEFVDAWGHPLRFYRWPTRLLRPGGGSIDLTQGADLLMPATPTDNTKDPDDPLGVTSGSAAPYGFENNYHSPDTYHTPLIVSGGPDEELGLYEPNDTTNFGHLAQPVSGERDSLTDNITNLNTSGGGE